MKQILFILTIILITSCEQTIDKKKIEHTSTILDNPKDSLSIDVALKFINSYVDNCNKMKESIGVVEWVNFNSLTTSSFKTELKRIIDEAYKIEPEIGLDADPIFDAQDYPDKGFELNKFDSKTNYIVVNGKNWVEFKLTIKTVLENNIWLIDGCGIINIPINKRIAR